MRNSSVDYLFIVLGILMGSLSVILLQITGRVDILVFLRELFP